MVLRVRIFARILGLGLLVMETSPGIEANLRLPHHLLYDDVPLGFEWEAVYEEAKIGKMIAWRRN